LLPKKVGSREIVKDAVVVEKKDVYSCTTVPRPQGAKNSNVIDLSFLLSTLNNSDRELYFSVYVQAPLWVYGKWKPNIFHHIESRLKVGGGIPYPRGTEISPVLVVVDCSCLAKLKEYTPRLLDYAEGGEVAPKFRWNETDETENDMNVAAYEERLERQRSGSLQEELRVKNAKRQGNDAVKTQVSDSFLFQ
jgi:hypothetical protein